MSRRRRDPLGKPKAWLVTGPLGRGLAFAVDFAVAVRTALAGRRQGGKVKRIRADRFL